MGASADRGRRALATPVANVVVVIVVIKEEKKILRVVVITHRFPPNFALTFRSDASRMSCGKRSKACTCFDDARLGNDTIDNRRGEVRDHFVLRLRGVTDEERINTGCHSAYGSDA